MKVVIAGSRTISDYEFVKAQIELSKFDITEVVSGGAQGVDSLGEQWAKENNIPIKVFKPDWDQWGKAAEPIRNEQMAIYCDAGIVLIDMRVQSRGSKNMVLQLQRYKKPRYVVYK